jgi:hypothetical protein
LYDVAQVVVWSAAFAKFKRDHQDRRIDHMPDGLAYLDAFNFVQQREHELIGAEAAFVCVPLAHDHPGRAWALRLACAGQPPGPFLDPEEWLEGMPHLPDPAPRTKVRKRTP